jgi:hypothetical protein
MMRDLGAGGASVELVQEHILQGAHYGISTR